MTYSLYDVTSIGCGASVRWPTVVVPDATPKIVIGRCAPSKIEMTEWIGRMYECSPLPQRIIFGQRSDSMICGTRSLQDLAGRAAGDVAADADVVAAGDDVVDRGVVLLQESVQRLRRLPVGVVRGFLRRTFHLFLAIALALREC